MAAYVGGDSSKNQQKARKKTKQKNNNNNKLKQLNIACLYVRGVSLNFVDFC